TAASRRRGLRRALWAWMRPIRPAPTSAMACCCMAVPSGGNGGTGVDRAGAGVRQRQCGDPVRVADGGIGAPVQDVGEMVQLGPVGAGVAALEVRLDRRTVAAG